MLQLHIAVMLFGLAGLFGKMLGIPATAIVFGRTFVAALALAGLLLLRRADSRLTLRLALALFPTGALLALHWLTFFHAIQLSSVSTGLLSFATYPIFVAFIDPLFSNRRIHGRDVVSAALVFAGLLLVVPSCEMSDRFVQGALWGLASAATFALLTLFNRRFVARTDAVTTGLFQNFWAAVCLCPFGASLLALNGSQVFQIIFLGVFCTALAHTLFILSLKKVRPQLASVTVGLEPVYGIVLAFLFLGECPRVRELVGGAMIVAVVVAVSWWDNRLVAEHG